MTVFTLYLAADWSAANKPTRGKDSIWLATSRNGSVSARNIPTRFEALRLIEELTVEEKNRGGRTLAGFDFAFGFQEGVAEAVTGQASWRAMWHLLAELVEDDEANRSNRFEVAGELNRRLGRPRFWGKPHQQAERYPLVPSTRPSASVADDRRWIEGVVSGAKPVFQLAYTGAVGSQSLLGIAGLEKLRQRIGAAIWPFETLFTDDLSAHAVFCEIYPSLFLRRHFGEGTKDEAQVRAVAAAIAAYDRAGRIEELLGPPPGAGKAALAAMLREEGSIMGAGVLGRSEGDLSCAS
ncbi:hypothetical protein [Parvularcula maris]|uniref:Cobalamin biosynthesis protein CbiG n=1 Tax=Parvularcula maris TaxID=2965077 RepID=A0A9X2RIE2_9PROT|nr:hypothetical protein [Parvularcula maris]MCQ8185955.1 hypothetical protein [Parvularcula maris]